MFNPLKHLTGRQMLEHRLLFPSRASCEASTVPKHQLLLLMVHKSSSCPLNIIPCGELNLIICMNINPFSP